MWTEDRQNDWFASAQQATAGSSSADVNGYASNARLMSVPVNLQGGSQATISFNWLIDSSLHTGEYVAFDVSTDGGSGWTEQARLSGNVDPGGVWQPVQGLGHRSQSLGCRV